MNKILKNLIYSITKTTTSIMDALDGHIHIYINDNQNFGWGKVNNSYPQNSLAYVNYANGTITCNGETFTRVYRYIGNNDE